MSDERNDREEEHLRTESDRILEKTQHHEDLLDLAKMISALADRILSETTQRYEDLLDLGKMISDLAAKNRERD